MKPYEIIEHTADIGIRASARSPEELFSRMAEGMFSLIVPPEQIRAVETRRIQVQADGWETLLVAWLRELLYRFDTEHFLGKEFQISRLSPALLEAVVSGEKLDPGRHPLGREVKAVTYCDLSVQQTASGVWTAQVIFDI